MKTIISNQENLEKLKSQIREQGFKSLHILTDFDRTLTYGVVNGVKTPSVISMLRDGKHLTEGYSEKAYSLFNKYHPIEVDQSIPLETKKRAMQEWWESHHKLLFESGLSMSDLEDIVNNGVVRFRDGVVEFLDFLKQYDIPLVVLSASGCGEVIELFFKKIGKDYPNILYVINKFNWDENGKAVSIKGPIIHSMNKDETILEKIPEVYEKIKDRKNVILLGDSIGDLGMVHGFDFNNLIKIGFLNFDSEHLRKEFEENFDIVVEGDGDFSFVNSLMRDIEK